MTISGFDFLIQKKELGNSKAFLRLRNTKLESIAHCYLNQNSRALIMWLKYGVAPNGELVSIHEISRGKSQLTCLYCGGELTAKKGSVKEHHFSHTTETCKPVSQRIKNKAFPSLPLYDNFNIQLKGKELEQLKVLWKQYSALKYPIPKDLINFRWVLNGLLYQFSKR